MMQTGKEREEWQDAVSDRRLWQQSRLIDAPEDEAERFLDLAGFADGLLDADEQDRVAALLAIDPDAAADVEAARSPARLDHSSVELERIAARASAILSDGAPPLGRVIPFNPRPRNRLVQHFAQWGSIAAAIAVASWLGFAMGTDASLTLSNSRQPAEAGILPELFDPASGFLRDLGEGLRT